MERELTIKIIVEDPVPGITYGLQQGNGADYETAQQQSDTPNLSFQFKVQVKLDKNNTPVFHGPFTQGPPKERFVYLDIGSYARQKNIQEGWRMKIPLTISQDMLNRVTPKSILLTKVPGTGKNGRPNSGTVKPFAGWKAM